MGVVVDRLVGGIVTWGAVSLGVVASGFVTCGVVTCGVVAGNCGWTVVVTFSAADKRDLSAITFRRLEGVLLSSSTKHNVCQDCSSIIMCKNITLISTLC